MNMPKLVDPDAAPATAPDPFDIPSLRLNPSFFETAGVKKLLTTVPVRKPGKQDFIRVHPEPEYRRDFAMIDLAASGRDPAPECLPSRRLFVRGSHRIELSHRQLTKEGHHGRRHIQEHQAGRD